MSLCRGSSFFATLKARMSDEYGLKEFEADARTQLQTLAAFLQELELLYGRFEYKGFRREGRFPDDGGKLRADITDLGERMEKNVPLMKESFAKASCFATKHPMAQEIISIMLQKAQEAANEVKTSISKPHLTPDLHIGITLSWYGSHVKTMLQTLS